MPSLRNALRWRGWRTRFDEFGKGLMKSVYTTSVESKIGIIHLASTKRGVCKITIPGQTKKDFLSWIRKHFEEEEIVESVNENREIIAELDRYFDRKLVRFHAPLDQIGTEFEKKVWSQLKKIPYGTTITYKDLARRVGNPGAYQSVGRANAANPLPIVIPCHRIVGSGGRLVGYAAGIKTKEFLLRLEGAMLL